MAQSDALKALDRWKYWSTVATAITELPALVSLRGRPRYLKSCTADGTIRLTSKADAGNAVGDPGSATADFFLHMGIPESIEFDAIASGGTLTTDIMVGW